MKVARGPRITLSITHRRAKAQAVSPDSRFKMLSNQERQQRRGAGGRGSHLGNRRHLGFSRAPPGSPVSQ